MTTTLAHHVRRAAHGLHRCGWCDGRIGARHEYHDYRCADEGTAWTFRAHLLCDALYDWARREWMVDEPESWDGHDTLREWWATFARLAAGRGPCPDGGTCHHGCGPLACYRVRYCGPLSGTYPADLWPPEVKAAHAVRLDRRGAS